MQKPISVDVVEGQAMLAAARKYKRVVQVGTQRRSTPHLIEARDRVIQRRQARHDRARRDLLLLPHARDATNPPDTAPPANLDYEMWTGPAPMRPYNQLVHPRSWRAFMEYGNGIVGDMCVHMLDMVRWMLDLGLPTRISSSGGILVDKKSKANITDTQTATFDFANLKVVWTHRTYGERAGSEVSVGRDVLRRQGHAQGERDELRLHARGPRASSRSTKTSSYELEQFPEDKTEKDLETPRRAGDPRAHEGLPRVHRVARSKPVADIEQGYISTAACILANLSHAARPLAHVGSREGRGRRRRRGEQAAAPALPRAVGASRSSQGLMVLITSSDTQPSP